MTEPHDNDRLTAIERDVRWLKKRVGRIPLNPHGCLMPLTFFLVLLLFLRSCS